MSWINKIGGQTKKLDTSLIRPYSAELQDREPLTAPYIAHFYGDKGKHLHYVAAKHGVGSKNDTCKIIENVMGADKPSIVIIEGIPSELGVSPESYQNYVSQQVEKGFPKSGEPAYAAHLAMENGVPFIGGEPSDREVFEFMEAQGYPAKDMMAFHLVRVIPGWVEHDSTDKTNIDEKAQDYLDNWPAFKHIGENERLTVEEFKEWYDSHNILPERTILDLKTNDHAPYRTPEANHFQKMNATLSDFREKHLVEQIDKALEEHDRVLVVYGSGHLVQSRGVFENIFPDVEHSKVK